MIQFWPVRHNQKFGERVTGKACSLTKETGGAGPASRRECECVAWGWSSHFVATCRRDGTGNISDTDPDRAVFLGEENRPLFVMMFSIICK